MRGLPVGWTTTRETATPTNILDLLDPKRAKFAPYLPSARGVQMPG